MHRDWPEERWRRLFDRLADLRLEELYLQWSEVDGQAVITVPVLQTVLGLAAQRGIRVWIGLAADTGFGRRILEEPRAVAVYLARLRAAGREVALRLAPAWRGQDAVAGWYIPEEIDDRNWQELARRRLLVDHLAALASELSQIAPELPVAVSGYTGAWLDPATLAALWSEIFAAASLDLLLFQDGLGVGRMRSADVEQYLSALRSAAVRSNRGFAVVVEVFRQKSGTSLDDRPFQAAPAPFERILDQLVLAGRYGGGGLVAFSVPEYMTPEAGAAARELSLRYRRWLRKSCGG